MSYWSLAVSELDGDGAPVFKATRRLSDDEFERLSAANAAFRKILGQTTWSVLQYNYSCFVLLERQLTEDVAAYSPTAHIHLEAVQVPIVASVVNFLTAMRMFLDQSATELKRLDKADSGNRHSAWKRACASEYDDYFAYRFLYKLRNYVQHVGLPLSAVEISVPSKQPEELVRRTLLGESPLDHKGDPKEAVTQVFLGESPSDLIKNYNRWSNVKAELEGLTTEIDLSEQIRVVMECLSRILQAFQEQFKVELELGVSDFKQIVGNLEDYGNSLPLLAEITRDHPLITIGIMDLEIERFLQAERLGAGGPD